MTDRGTVRVLITGAGTATAISVLKGLRLQDEVQVRVVMADARETVAGRYLADDFVLVPSAPDSSYLSTMKEICCSREIDLLIPIVDSEFPALAAAAEDFAANGTHVVISAPRVISICADKLVLARFLQSLGLLVARSYTIDEATSGLVPFPLFVKPRTGGRASIGAQRVDYARELEVALHGLADPLVQEFIDGDEYTIDTLSDFHGRFIAAMPRIRLETKAGVSVKGRTVDDAEMVEVARTITEALHIIGPSNIQCFRRADGPLVVSEVNPRFSGAFALSLAAGLSSPLVLLRLARGDRVGAGELQLSFGVTMVRYWQEVFTLDDGTEVADPWPRWKPAGSKAACTR